MTKGSEFDTFLCIPTTIRYFIYIQCRLSSIFISNLPETPRNLSDKRLKLTHVNFIQRDSDAEPTRQLINIEVSYKITSNHNRANLSIVSQPIRKKGQNLSFLHAIRQRNVSGPLPPGYKRKKQGLLAR